VTPRDSSITADTTASQLLSCNRSYSAKRPAQARAPAASELHIQ
jgi:hypothetical protein